MTAAGGCCALTENDMIKEIENGGDIDACVGVGD